MEITYTNSVTAEECGYLRDSAGWPQMHTEQIKTGLSNSFYIIAAKHGEKTVGMARIVSDGGYVVFISDVLVLPEYQNKGIGKRMLEILLDYIKNTLKEGYSIQIDLLAAKGKEEFYEKFGFIKRPNDTFGCGMTQRLSK